MPYNACLPYLDNSVFLPKTYYNIKTNKQLSPWLVSKMITAPYDGNEYKKRIRLRENSPNEIKSATIQIVNLIDKKYQFKKMKNIFLIKCGKNLINT